MEDRLDIESFETVLYLDVEEVIIFWEIISYIAVLNWIGGIWRTMCSLSEALHVR